MSSWDVGGEDVEIRPPATHAITPNQLASIAELPRTKKFAKYEEVCREGKLEHYFAISCRPITKKAEDDMELVSDLVTWGEKYLHHWERGVYCCARCAQPLYQSVDKWKGPCVWPSFRKSVTPLAISTTQVYPYNAYEVVVKEVYCGQCHLFIGHMFEDGKQKGDHHPEARWRH